VIVVTGAGLIGGRIISTLALERGADVVVVDDDLTPSKRSNFAGAPVRDELSPGRLLELGDTDPGFSGQVEAVIHTGARTDTWERATARVLDANFRYSARLLRWCLGRRIPFLYASSSAVYGNPRPPSSVRLRPMLSPYALSKLLFDHRVMLELPDAKSPVTGLRFFNVYGPGEAHKGRMASVVFQFHKQLRESGAIDIYSHPSLGAPGSQRRDLVHLDDIVATTLWFLDHGRSGIYEVGTGTAISYERLAQLVLAHAGSGSVRYTPLPTHLLGSYQTHTEADLRPLRAAGYDGSFRPPGRGVPEYLGHLDGVAALRTPAPAPFRSAAP
jgi:ADP-L-glycero-D-manno-heptose 6-epimerase